jgi:4-hydroxy-3-methylbut-2-enyl diphosphate reductase IspH
VHGSEDLRADWLDGVEVLGVTAGASTPDYLIDEVEEAARVLVGQPAAAS